MADTITIAPSKKVGNVLDGVGQHKLLADKAFKSELLNEWFWIFATEKGIFLWTYRGTPETTSFRDYWRYVDPANINRAWNYTENKWETWEGDAILSPLLPKEESGVSPLLLIGGAIAAALLLFKNKK